jgi:DNA-binding transcriptional LysR family regulator
MNLRSIDLNLLVVFEALMDTRSVGRAAQKVGMSPSAMSHGLRRLRATFDDELLKRTADGLVPTLRALDLVDPIRAALRQIQYSLARQLDFDPKTSERTFKIQFSDYFFTGGVLTDVCTRVQAEAPGVKLIVEHLAPGAGLDLGDTGSIRVQVNFGDGANAPYERERLLEERFVLVMRRSHPAARKRMTPELFCTLRQLRLSLPASGANRLDDFLGRHGLSRRVALEIPNPLWLLSIVRKTNLCAIVPERWTELRGHGSELALVSLPVSEDRFAVDQLWHTRNDRDAGHRWLRGLVAQRFREFSLAGDRSNGRQLRRARPYSG